MKVEKVPGEVDKSGNCLYYWEDTLSTKSVFPKEPMHTTGNKLDDFEYACINISILIAMYI